MHSLNIMYVPLRRINFTLVVGVLLVLSSSVAHAQSAATSTGLSRDGIFGCRAAQYANIGTLTAIGGVYVPVNDAAVTLNTGYLVYKECVLDGVVSAIRNDIASGLQGSTIRAVETSRNGNAQYYKNREDLRPDIDAIVVEAVTATQSGNMCGAYKNRVASAIARNYYSSTREGNKDTLCPFISNEAEREAIVRGNQPVNWSTSMGLFEPRGYELGAYNTESLRVESQIISYETDVREQLQWGNGFFPAFDNAQNPLARNVITPASVIAGSLQRMLNVGTDILVNANEIDQINGSLQAGLQSSLIADTIRGLTGFSRQQNGQPSYVDRMTAEASGSVRSNAVNAALSILSAARQVEMTYKGAKEGIATGLTNAIGRLHAAENTCWGLIIPKVQDEASSRGVSLRIATSTQFSKKIIDEQIQPVATIALRDLAAADAAVTLINQLIVSVTNTSSAAAQRAALERLDSMVANNQLHSSAQATAAQTEKDQVVAAVATLVDDTLKNWGDSTDTAVGWCNVNNDAVIDMWLDRWSN